MVSSSSSGEVEDPGSSGAVEDPPDVGEGEGSSGGDDAVYPAMEWSYVPIPGATCRNGNPTGILYNPNPDSDKVFVFLEEGAACFNAFSCNVAFTFDPSEADIKIYTIEESFGASNRASPNNPFADYNLVFVPYCSGDVYAGDASDVDIAGTTYQFKGYNNVTLIFEFLQQQLGDPAQMVLAGTSAGGWGAGFNYPKARAMFPESEVILIDDSAAYMGNAFIPPCWQQRLRELWNLDATLPEDCDGCFDSADGSFVEQLILHILDTYPDFRGGLLETSEDAQMRLMLGYGEHDCAQFDGLFPPEYPAQKFSDGLVDLRDNIVANYPGFRVFYDVGLMHGFISHTTYGQLLDTYPPRYDVAVENTTVTQWLQAAVDGGEWHSVSAF